MGEVMIEPTKGHGEGIHLEDPELDLTYEPTPEEPPSWWFSPSRCSFYLEDMKETYEASDEGWPEDAHHVDTEVYMTFMGGEKPEGLRLGADEEGNPAWVEDVMDAEAQGVWAGYMRSKALRETSEELHLMTAKGLLGRLTDEERKALEMLVMEFEALKG